MLIKILREGMYQEQGYILWLAVYKRYRFIHDFGAEVMREKYLRFDFELAPADYDVFFYRYPAPQANASAPQANASIPKAKLAALCTDVVVAQTKMLLVGDDR